MSWYKPVSARDKVFEVSLLLKGLSGLTEFLGGLLLFKINPDQLTKFIALITQRELIQDPSDLVANWLLMRTQHISLSSHVFLITYLWIHALIKLTAVIGILRNKLWAYPFSLVTLGLLMIYQIYSIIFVNPSAGMVLLTAFDAFVLWMIWQEYHTIRQSH